MNLRNVASGRTVRHSQARQIGSAGTFVLRRHTRKWVAAISIVGMSVIGVSPAFADDAVTDPVQAADATQLAAAEAPTPVQAAAPPQDETPPPADPPPAAPPVDTPVAPAPDAPVAAPPAAAPQPLSAPAAAPEAPASEAPAPDAAVVAVPHVRWTAVDELGNVVPGVTFTLQGPRNLGVADDGEDSQWVGSVSARVVDNTGDAGYVGLDTDPVAGAFTVEHLVSETDSTVAHDVAAGEELRVRPAEAAPFVVGDAAEWAGLSATAPEAVVTNDIVLVMPAETEVAASPQSRDATAGAESIAAPFALAALPAAGTYKPAKDDSNPTTWEGGGSPCAACNLTSFTSAYQHVGSNWILGATWVRPTATGAMGWSVEYTNAAERWGTATPSVPQPDRSQGGMVLLIRNDNTGAYTAKLCVYTPTVKYPGTCQTVSPSLTSPDGGFTMNLSLTLPSSVVGSPGCPSTLGSIGYLRSWTSEAENIQAWTAPVAVNPPSTCGTTTIEISKMGDRTGPGVTDASPVAGAEYTAYTSTTGNPGAPGTTVLGTCTTNALGVCSIPVSNSNSQGVWIEETNTPEGWLAIPALGTGNYQNAKANTLYRFKVAITANSSNVTKRVTADKVAPATDVSGKWVNARVNPGFPQACGVSIAMVFDTSASIGQSEMTEFKNAARLFVGSGGLGGTPSSVTMFRFDTTASAMNGGALYNLAVQGSAGSNTGWEGAQNQISTGLPSAGNGSGYTNWDAALRVVKATGNYDMVIVLTDGDPTAYGASGASTDLNVQFRSVEQAVLSANALKATSGPAGAKTKIVGIGVGMSTNSELNLQAITGPVAGSDYYLAADFAALQTTLRGLAVKNCGSSVTVIKELQDHTGTVVTSSAANWEFTAAGDTVNASPKTQTTTTSGTNFGLTFNDLNTHSITITETAQDDYSLHSVVCTGAAGSVTVAGLTATVPVKLGNITSCTFKNREVPKAATLQVDKAWLVTDSLDNVIYDSETRTGELPAGMTAALGVTNPGPTPYPSPPLFGDVIEGLVGGQTVTISESSTIRGLPGCTTESTTIKRDGATTSTPLGSGLAVTLDVGENKYVITNAIVCETQLTVLKSVQGGGSGVPADWNLSITNTNDDTDATTVAGANTVTAANTIDVSAAQEYELSEAFANEGSTLAYVFKQLERCISVEVSPCSEWAVVDANTPVSVPLGSHEVYRFVNVLAPSIALPLTGGVAGALYGSVGMAIALLAALLGVATWMRREARKTAMRL